MTATPTAEHPAVKRDPITEPPAVTDQLVVQMSYLGDAVLTTPLITELAMRAPVDVVTTPSAAPVLANNPHIRTLHVYDRRGEDAGAAGLHRMAQRIREGVTGGKRSTGHRVAYLADGTLRSGALAALGNYQERVGFQDAAGRLFYSHRVARRVDRHQAERLWRLAFPSSPTVEPPDGALRPRLYPGAPERAAVERLLAPWSGARFIAIAPGSVWATKRWPYYSRLAARLALRHHLVVVGSPEDSDLARAIVDAAGPDRAIDATATLSLLGSTELIAHAALLITNDSSPQHLASATSTPTITLFGPTVPANGFGPLAPHSRAAELIDLSCRPCHPQVPLTCPLSHWRCMRDLTVEQIERTVITFFERR